MGLIGNPPYDAESRRTHFFPPAVCSGCGKVAIQNHIGFGGESSIGFEGGFVTGNCADCGAYLRIVDGVYESVDGVLQGVNGVAPTDVDALLQVLRQVQHDELDRDAALAAIEQIAPDFAETARNVLVGDWKFRLALVIAILAWLFPRSTSYEGPTTEEIANAVVQQMATTTTTASPPTTLPKSIGAVPKVGRNEPCWCGSTRKFKFCHGGVGKRP